VPFYVNPASEWSTIRADWAQRNERLGSPSTGSLTVTALPFGDLLERHGVPHYLKIDIEGADLLCLEALDPAEPPNYVSIESEKRSWPALVHEFDLLGTPRVPPVLGRRAAQGAAPGPPSRPGRASTCRGASA